MEETKAVVESNGNRSMSPLSGAEEEEDLLLVRNDDHEKEEGDPNHPSPHNANDINVVATSEAYKQLEHFEENDNEQVNLKSSTKRRDGYAAATTAMDTTDPKEAGDEEEEDDRMEEEEEEGEIASDSKEESMNFSAAAAEDREKNDKTGEEEDDEDDDDSRKPDSISYATRGRSSQDEMQQQHQSNATGSTNAIISSSTASALDKLAWMATSTSAAAETSHPTTKTQQKETVLPSAPPIMRESFLSDSLTEEERRTRTRYLPNVEGMHALRKHEIKADLALARAIVTSSSSTTAVTWKGGGKQRGGSAAANASGYSSREFQRTVDDSDERDKSDDGMMMTMESGMNRPSFSIEVGEVVLPVPSPAFVAPPVETAGKSSSVATATTSSSVVAKPSEVEAITAFNPPRPPESVGAKKKHRLLRWERRPADIEMDITSYRKTVQRTREELVNARAERERVEIVDNLLRRHFLKHIRLANLDLQALSREMNQYQQACIEIADLVPTSRTRTRGTKGNSVLWRDVIQSLQAKGAEMEAKGISFGDRTTKNITGINQSSGNNIVPSGVGGVPVKCFRESIQPNDQANGTSGMNSCGADVINAAAGPWVVPGDHVHTPYGQGTVVAVVRPGPMDANQVLVAPEETSIQAESDDVDAMEVEPTGSSTTGNLSRKKSEATSKFSKIAPATSVLENDTLEMDQWMPPRIVVRMSFGGLAYFNVDSVSSKEDPARYSDRRLAERWKGLLETAKSVSGVVDVDAIENFLASLSQEHDSLMDVDTTKTTENQAPKHGGKRKRLLPLDASLLPTALYRGAFLHNAGLAALDQGMDKAFCKKIPSAVLGLKGNKGVPRMVRDLEDRRRRRIDLQAKVLHLRNQLHRQRRIRLLNERAFTATQEKSSRVEALVSEMRTDLKSLKNRLDLEIRDLGISEEHAENILTSYYMSLDAVHGGEASPPKRQRRHSHMNDEFGETDDEIDDTGGMNVLAAVAGAAAGEPRDEGTPLTGDDYDEQ
jgi:hypothetical protein